MHVFPNPVKFPERFKAWVDLVGEKPEIPLDVEYFKKKRICDIHFIPEHRNRNKRLNALAIPLLNLPGELFICLTQLIGTIITGFTIMRHDRMTFMNLHTKLKTRTFLIYFIIIFIIIKY